MNCLTPLGRHDEAIAQLRRAQEVDPLSISLAATVGLAFYFAGRSFGQNELDALLAAGARANICGSPLFPGSGSLVIMQSGR